MSLIVKKKFYTNFLMAQVTIKSYFIGTNITDGVKLAEAIFLLDFSKILMTNRIKILLIIYQGPIFKEPRYSIKVFLVNIEESKTIQKLRWKMIFIFEVTLLSEQIFQSYVTLIVKIINIRYKFQYVTFCVHVWSGKFNAQTSSIVH